MSDLEHQAGGTDRPEQADTGNDQPNPGTETVEKTETETTKVTQPSE